MTKKWPCISISLVTYNSASYLEACLDALQKSQYPDLEVVLLDNASRDNSVKIAKKWWLKAQKKSRNPIKKFHLIAGHSNLGYAGGHNVAISAASSHYVLLLNPDTVVTPGSLQPLVTALQNPKVAAAQPLVYLLKNPDQINLSGKVTQFLGFDWMRDYQKTKPSREKQLTSISGSGVLINREHFLAAGGFDETYFMYYEDSDLSWRWRLMGLSLVFVATAVFYHDYSFMPDEEYLPSQQKFFWAERNRVVTILKNYQATTLLLIAPTLLMMEFFLCGYSLLSGFGWQKLRSYLDIFRLITHVSQKRHQVTQLRKVSDRALAKSILGPIQFVHFSHPILNSLVNPVLDAYWQRVRNWL